VFSTSRQRHLEMMNPAALSTFLWLFMVECGWNK